MLTAQAPCRWPDDTVSEYKGRDSSARVCMKEAPGVRPGPARIMTYVQAREDRAVLSIVHLFLSTI